MRPAQRWWLVLAAAALPSMGASYSVRRLARPVMVLTQQQTQPRVQTAPLADLELVLVPAAAVAGDDESSATLRARGTLAVVAAAYGTNYAFVKMLDVWAGSAAVGAALRFSVAAAALLPVLGVLCLREPRLTSWPLARSGLEAGACFAAGYGVQALALQTSDAGVQAFLLSLAVVVCPILEQVVCKTRQPPRVWLAAALAALGVLALECGSPAGFGSNPGDMLGMLQVNSIRRLLSSPL